jgi:hypothetical protein
MKMEKGCNGLKWWGYKSAKGQCMHAFHKHIILQEQMPVCNTIVLMEVE